LQYLTQELELVLIILSIYIAWRQIRKDQDDEDDKDE
jgi:hypothetical protein